jgi:hypothetical protein
VSPAPPRARGGRIALVGAVLVLSGLPAGSSAQTAPTAFVGYQSQATGTALSAFPTLPALLPVEVPFEATLSLATATLSSGGEGFGRASTFFPGTLAAGLRPLLSTAGVPLPIPDYPVVVESREYEGAKHADLPGITMTTDVDADGSTAVAGVGAIGIPGILGVRSIHTESSGKLEVGRITATSTTRIQGLELGALSIQSLVSVASVSSDGATSTCSGGVTITGAMVSGTPVTIDSSGITGLNPVLAQVLAATGLTARLLEGADGCTSAIGSRTTAGLLVTVPVPEGAVIPVGGGLTLVLGSTAASAGGSTLDPDAPVDVAAPPDFGDAVTRLPGPLTGGGFLVPATPTPSGATPRAVVPRGFPIEDAAYRFDGVPASLVVGLLLLALAGSVRLRRYMRHIIDLIGPT